MEPQQEDFSPEQLEALFTASYMATKHIVMSWPQGWALWYSMN